MLLSVVLLLYVLRYKKPLEQSIVRRNNSNSEPYHLPRYPETDVRGFRRLFTSLSLVVGTWLFGVLILGWQLLSNMGWAWNTTDYSGTEWHLDTVQVVLLPPPPTPEAPPPKPQPKPAAKPASPPKRPAAANRPSANPENRTPVISPNPPPPDKGGSTADNTASDSSNTAPANSSNDTTKQNTEQAAPQIDLLTLSKLPTFKGGSLALISYLQRNLQYPPNARERGLEGIIYVGCEIKADGTVGFVKPAADIPNSGFAREAMRVVSTLPAWEPAEQDGKKVRSFVYIPIKFQLR